MKKFVELKTPIETLTEWLSNFKNFRIIDNETEIMALKYENAIKILNEASNETRSVSENEDKKKDLRNLQ